jgi:propionyl-CoA carboxylase alpha chain
VVKFTNGGDGAEHRVSLNGETVKVDGVTVVVDAPFIPGQRLIEATVDGEPLSIRVERKRTGWRFTTRGASHELRVLPPHIADVAHHMIEKVPPDLSRFLLCPMPGLITAVHVEAGAKVEAGQMLAVVEAMKMENLLRAEKAGTVKAILAKPGDSLAVDAVIMEFE